MCFLIKDDGDVDCLYTDKINLKEIGKLDVSRASTVEWDNDIQGWVVDILIDGHKIGPFDSREDALCAEVEYLNGKYLGGN